MTTIRLASPDDLPQLATLFNAYRVFYEQASDIRLAEQFVTERLNNKDSAILVAINSEQKIIGFCQIYPSFCSVIAARIGVLYDLFVDPSVRKSGAGKALMIAAHEYAAKHDFARLDLTTAKTNLPAQALYESLGWVRDEVFYSYSKEIT
ncbi:GNAT family N-acetyltransferase [Methyloradius palustris]|uniref:N-acetyltransferase n=1 Tax=Methyloradius palustris TaxID=2778876 RepID=A0A8D5JR13_9PROT|nr:GNAT family N-acetyltransferase [Methyloradius palustris]BCM25016.1 N-acetyltransferase [Methyloradius palustris]